MLSQDMAVGLLKLFEQQPVHWEAIRWLNSRPSPEGEPFEKYLQRWHDAVPQNHKPFVEKLAHLFGLPIESNDGSRIPPASGVGENDR
jgi:hypothetical protein